MTPAFIDHGPTFFPMPNSPPLEVPWRIDLSHFYDDIIDPSYRKYGPSLIRFALH